MPLILSQIFLRDVGEYLRDEVGIFFDFHCKTVAHITVGDVILI